jgi:ABC-type polysaccharide/polyol phosphate transport system ATPase subunit
VSFEHADISWGYKAKTQNQADKAKAKDKYAGTEVEEVHTPIVADVNLKMKQGDFMTIIGSVGCGKTTVLFSVMQETQIMKGKCDIQGSIAYVE